MLSLKFIWNWNRDRCISTNRGLSFTLCPPFFFLSHYYLPLFRLSFEFCGRKEEHVVYSFYRGMQRFLNQERLRISEVPGSAIFLKPERKRLVGSQRQERAGNRWSAADSVCHMCTRQMPGVFGEPCLWREMIHYKAQAFNFTAFRCGVLQKY